MSNYILTVELTNKPTQPRMLLTEVFEDGKKKIRDMAEFSIYDYTFTGIANLMITRSFVNMTDVTFNDKPYKVGVGKEIRKVYKAKVENRIQNLDEFMYEYEEGYETWKNFNTAEI